MPPHTRSNTMGDTSSDGVERGVGTSNPMPGSEFTSMMSKMMADLKHELRESQVKMHATQNALFGDLNELKESMVSIREEVITLNEARTPRPLTSKSDSKHHHAFEGNNKEREDDEWNDYGGHGGECIGNRFRMNERFGNGNGMHGRRGNRGPEHHGGLEYGNLWME